MKRVNPDLIDRHISDAGLAPDSRRIDRVANKFVNPGIQPLIIVMELIGGRVIQRLDFIGIQDSVEDQHFAAAFQT